MTWGRVVLSVHLSNVSRLKSDKAGLEVSATRPSTPPPQPPPLVVVRQLESKKSSSSLCPGRQAGSTSRGCERNSELDTDVLPCRPAADHAGLKMPGWQAGPYSKSGIPSEIQKAKNTTFGFIVVFVSEFVCSEAEQRKKTKVSSNIVVN